MHFLFFLPLIIFSIIGIISLPSSFSDETILVNQQIKIPLDFANTKSESQPFAYIVQIKDENMDVVSLSWVTGQAIPSQELGMSVSWMPEESGKYLIERFVWNSIKAGIPLTDASSEEIIIK